MAIAINAQPSDSVSLNNEILYVVYESVKANNEVTYPDYRYVCDVYVASVLVGRLKARPDPTYKRGIFDIAGILRSYITYGIKVTYTNVVEFYTTHLVYTVKFGEEYDDVLYTDLTLSSNREAYRSYEIRPFDDSDVMGDVDADFATSAPQVLYSDKSVKWQLLPYWDNVSGITNFTATCYDANGSQVGSTATYSTSGFVAKQIFQMNVGFLRLVQSIPLSTSEQAQISYYEISNGTKTKRFYLKCDKYPVYTLAWLNKYGAYESYYFSMVSRKQTELTRKEFQQLNYRINSSGEIIYYENGAYYGGRRGFAVDIKTTLKMTSHLLNEDEYEWLSEMFHSPEVYLYNSDRDKFMPVSIQETSYEFRTYLNSRQKPLEFSVMYSDNYNSQLL
jgi:hypothetical protein